MSERKIKADEIVLDCLGMVIPPGEWCLITSHRREPSEGPFRCQRLEVRSDLAPHFHIEDLKIGNHSVFASLDLPHGVPATEHIDFDRSDVKIVQVCVFVEIQVRNTSDRPLIFTAVINGITPDGEQ